jgi:hypothetical protein
MATLVWPSVAHWCRRLVETLTALILSKFVIVATLSLAAGAVGSGTAGTGDAGSGFASVLAGGALLVLATFVPFSILRLIPMVEAGAVGHLEGARQRGAASLTRLPRSAAQHALSKGLAANGAAKLLAQAGPPGTGGADGTGGAGGMWADVAGTAADCNGANGGLIPDENGMMIGLAGSGEAFMERMRADPPPRGPKPLLPSPAEARQARREAAEGTASSPEDASLPPGSSLIGKPGPYERRYALGSDHMGPKLWGLPPLRARDEKPPVDEEGPS